MQQNTPTKRLARTAGLLYLVVVVTGIFALMYVPSQLKIGNDPVAVLASIDAHEGLFRAGIAASLVCYLAFLLLPLALYKLLSPYGRSTAAVMVALAVASVPLSFANVGHRLEVLNLINGADYLRGMTPDALAQQVMLSLKAYSKGMVLNQVFWSLWLGPFGYLVYRSGILPKVLGILLMVGSAGYATEAFGYILQADFTSLPGVDLLSIPASLGEIGTCLWLCIMGAREPAHSAGAYNTGIKIARN
ncbi:protein of unknown function [Duganella sp. CF458]|uniref:DUF4386 domain-containing protein n=1 Tax=Duganella sp. CF458 TaxID=1884368 RepID=UPI0008ED5582|nr:DUF4386 domain-containing protein [Duganella sp. CF458]SFG85653.1 protein of unknown function [Duganella sp. CF458]